MRAPVTTLAVAAALAAGCGPKVDVSEPSPFDEDDPRAGGIATPEREPAADPAPAPPAPGAARAGTIPRDTLVRVLDEGPARFLRGVEIMCAPRPCARSTFTGWEVVEIFEGETRFDGLDLRRGDVITEINGSGLMLPEDVFTLWGSLREAEAIVVSVRRGNDRFELRFDVTDPPDAAP